MLNIHQYSEELPAQFKVKAEQIRRALGEEAAIEHVGSSAVGIGGKNIIDILVGVKNIREAHKNRSESALDDPNYDPVGLMTETLDELQNFKGSQLEKAVFIFCKSNGIIYSKLTDEEKLWLTRIIKKSKTAKSTVSQRGKK